MKLYGLVGFPLTHSFSKQFFDQKFNAEQLNAEYRLFPLKKINELPSLVKSKKINGLNVTIPHKEQAMRFLTDVSTEAEIIGAVNVIKVNGNALSGYNTDYWAFQKSLVAWMNELPENALILGTGGSSKAVQYALQQLKVKFNTVSRFRNKGDFTYEQVNENPEMLEKFKLIVNTTPVGMYPREHQILEFPFENFTKQHYVYDLIYNPAKTILLKKAEECDATVKNGYEMLVKQAQRSWEIWNNQ